MKQKTSKVMSMDTRKLKFANAQSDWLTSHLQDKKTAIGVALAEKPLMVKSVKHS
jgi:hypothetical protein